MDIEIEEMNAEITVVDMRAIKADVIAAVLAHLEELKRLDKRREADRRVDAGATRRGLAGGGLN